MAMLLRGTRSGWNPVSFGRYFSRTPTRVTGYVNYFHPTENFGFCVADDDPTKEYHFTASDLHCENLPKVRIHAKVEFSTVETNYGRLFARDVSGPMGRALNYRHANMRVPQDQQSLLLSDLGDDQRYTGIISYVDETNTRGFICPDKYQYRMVSFDVGELQTTGVKTVKQFSEVEFSVERRDAKKDKATRITRPGGGVITTEGKELGGRRRALGAMYGARDKLANIPSEMMSNRKTGFVCELRPDKLYCHISPHDNPYAKYYCSFDDLHIYGDRMPRLMEPVEFSEEIDAKGVFNRAIFVTGQNRSVIQSSLDNELLGDSQRTRLLEPEPGKIYTGIIHKVLQPPAKPQEVYGFILPDEVGAREIYFHRYGLRITDFRKPQVKTRVQFEVRQLDDGKITAHNIYGLGGIPFTSMKGGCGDFYRGHGVEFNDTEYPPVTNDRLQGFICGVAGDIGYAEIIDLDKRYKRVVFNRNEISSGNIIPAWIEFNIEHHEENDKQVVRATNITTVGRNSFDASVRYPGPLFTGRQNKL